MTKHVRTPRTRLGAAGNDIVADDATKIRYLLRHGWRHKLVGNPWQWEKPPLPARYRLDDAYDLERSRDGSESR